MISVTVDFNPDDFEKIIISQMTDNFKSQLQRAGLSNIKIKIVKERSELKLHLEGDEVALNKAKEVLGVNQT